MQFKVKLGSASPPTLREFLRRIVNRETIVSSDAEITYILEYGPALDRIVCPWRATFDATIATIWRRSAWIDPKVYRITMEGYIEPESGLLVIRTKLAGRSNQFSRWLLPGRVDRPLYFGYGFSHIILHGAVGGIFHVVRDTDLMSALAEVKTLAPEWLKNRPATWTPLPKPGTSMTAEIELA